MSVTNLGGSSTTSSIPENKMIMREITIVPWDKQRVAPRRNFNINKPLKERRRRSRGPSSNYGVPVVSEVWFGERILNQRMAKSQAVLERKTSSNPQHPSQRRMSDMKANGASVSTCTESTRQERAGLKLACKEHAQRRPSCG